MVPNGYYPCSEINKWIDYSNNTGGYVYPSQTGNSGTIMQPIKSRCCYLCETYTKQQMRLKELRLRCTLLLKRNQHFKKDVEGLPACCALHYIEEATTYDTTNHKVGNQFV